MILARSLLQLWIMLPPASYVMVWMTGVSALLYLIVGVKLESICNQVGLEGLIF